MNNIIPIRHPIYYYKIYLASKKIEIECIYKSSARKCINYFAQFEKPDFIVGTSSEEIQNELDKMRDSMRVDDECRDLGVEADYGDIEFSLVSSKIAKAFMNYHTLMIHGAAIAIDNKCYIFTAPSGTGKSTHIFNWLKMIPGSFVVNGDKPLVNVKSKLVYGSPWCGKEGMNTNTCVPLAGIIFLERGAENKIYDVSFRDILHLLLGQIYIPQDREYTLKAFELIDKLKDVFCYRLLCNMDPESAIVSYSGIKYFEAKHANMTIQ